MFTLTLKTTSAAFEEYPAEATADALREVMVKLEDGFTSGRIFDVNGVRVGSFELITDEEDDSVSEARARVIAYLDEMERVQAYRQQYADESHAINGVPLRRSDLRKLVN